jgi:(1->4)-alpha-D-glucan 1-alpha-D-glucosylmutase
MASNGSHTPVSTYRLQLNRGFTFHDAAAVVDYLDALGVTDLYLSPVFKAAPGSVHGYDVLDHGQLNPELGGEEAFLELTRVLEERGMRLLLDIVPNHMYIATSENLWWNDVLENGPGSLFAGTFDIDFTPPKPDLANKVLLPVLSDQFGRVLESQEIRLVREGGSFQLEHQGRIFPLGPKTWTAILEPVIAPLRFRLEEADPGLLELESILTAIRHLPAREDIDPERVQERRREKEIVKGRLLALLEASPGIRDAIDYEVAKLNGRKGEPRSFDALEALLSQQAYRLSYWRVASDEINYRRFFDINELAAIRVERSEVFDAVHALPFRLVERHGVSGLRVDHVDGLFDPKEYLGRLPAGLYVVVEKILMGEERLRPGWSVAGTTGYEFLNLLNGIFVDPDAGESLRETFRLFSGAAAGYGDVVYECKKLILQASMSSELTVLARKLDRVSEQHRYSRDFTLNSLQAALSELIACFPVYRSYLRADGEEVDAEDRRHVEAAVRQARRRNPLMSHSIFDFLRSLLLLEDPEGLEDAQRHERRDFLMTLQQVTGPVTAKAVEDTAFYRYYPLASLNEVGGNPDAIGLPLERFHATMEERQRRWPGGLSASSTHDTKRSEDVRARLNVLSEIPDRFRAAVLRFRELNRGHKRLIENEETPGASEEYLLYQTLAASWPIGTLGDAERAEYLERIQAYLQKALREAKLRTSWIRPDEEYERAISEFLAKVLSKEGENPFLEELVRFQASLLRPGLFNSAAQTLLKMAAPGVPDFYQGTEIWDFSLVDPDNRRPVDFAKRHEMLASLDALERSGADRLAESLLAHLESGELKLFLVSRGLAFRRRRSELFHEGEYRPVAATGERAAHVIAFCRSLGERQVLAAAARFYTRLPDPPVGARAWGDSSLALDSSAGTIYREILTGRDLPASAGTEGPSLALAEVFALLPVALLERTG